jgi:hypothetical protein
MHQHISNTTYATHKGTEVALHIPHEKHRRDIIALSLGFLVWAGVGAGFGALVVNIGLTYLPFPKDFIAGLTILGGFVGWMSSGIFLLYRPAKQLFGREHIRLTPDGMTLSTSVLNIEQTTHYPFRHILNLRLRFSENASASEGMLLFDDYAHHQTVEFGKGLSRHEAKRLVTTLADALVTSSASAMPRSSASDIDHILFGVPPFQVYYVPHTTIQNPEVSHREIPCNNLRHIIVYTATYEFHQVERFLTYVVNAIGQQRLKKQVDVHIYGEPEHLQRNLLNNFANLCKQVYVHGTDDMLIPKKKKAN